MSQNDPTDHALAAIANILDNPEPPGAKAVPASASVEQSYDAPAEPIIEGGEGYAKYGPGPLDSLRFRWRLRKGDEGAFYVDETIGGSSQPISSAPLSREDAIALIDEREREARRRYNALRNEIISGPTTRGTGG